MLIADNLTYHSRPDFPDPTAALPEVIRDSFVQTRCAAGIFERILQSLAIFPNPQLRALLLVGSPGTGKTHILRYIAGLLENLSDPGWNALIPHIERGIKPDRPRHSLIIRVPTDPEVNLARHLLPIITGEPTAAARTEDAPLEEFASRIPPTVQRCASANIAVVVLDDVSRRISQISSEKQLQNEMQLYRILIEALVGWGILPILVGEDRHFRRDQGSQNVPVPQAVLSTVCDFLWLGPDNIVEILTSVLATKDARQKEAIRGLLDLLRRRLPTFEPSTETFVDLYPVHPFLFSTLFQAGSILPGFSPLRFLQEKIPTALGWPEEQLILADQLFDTLIPELRTRGKFRHLLASFESFRTNVLPRFKAAVQPRVEALLKVIALSTVCEAGPMDVKSLANALLLCEDSEFLPSYSLTSALLMEMEQKGGIYLAVDGEKQKRSYRLIDLINPPILSATRDLLEGADEFRRRFPLLLCDWIHSEVPSWKPDFSAKYERSSQSLVVTLPEGERKLTGLVYFKSEHDPFWSQEDFQVLEASHYSWILLLLSPLERSNDSNDSLREFASRSSRVLIWRPDKPTLNEVGRLQELVSHHPALGPASAFETSAVARNQTRRILRAMYVERGQLLTSEDEWFIGGEIENRTLPQYLSAHLSALAVPGSELLPGGTPVQQPAHAAGWATEKQALGVAAALAGLEEHQARDPEFVRSQFLEWWNGVLETEDSVLSPKSHPLPDSLMSTRFWSEVKSARNHLQTIKPCVESLRTGEASLADALGEVLRSFGGEEKRLMEWRDAFENLASLARWLPEYEHTKDYVVEAFPLGQSALDQRRAHLLESISQPHRFIQPAERERFDREFLEFKKAYIDYYQSIHEEALNIVSASKEAERKIDAKSLQNLELLSTLIYTDKSYLNRVRILGKWILHNQCLLPVREILERYPRCYCNFNPAGNRELAESAAQINGVIQEGIEYFRDALRKCSLMIIEDVRTSKVEEVYAKQIAALLSHGPLDSLKPRTVEILNKIIEKHSSDFLIALRS